jgi:hypothetical protein
MAEPKGSANQLHPSLLDRSRPRGQLQEPKQRILGGGGGKAQEGSVPGGAIVALTEEERKKIRAIILKENVAQESRANFKVQVGTKVPEGVRLRPLPSEAVQLVPRFKEFDFVIAGDRIAIVQRSTREIDSLIPL